MDLALLRERWSDYSATLTGRIRPWVSACVVTAHDVYITEAARLYLLVAAATNEGEGESAGGRFVFALAFAAVVHTICVTIAAAGIDALGRPPLTGPAPRGVLAAFSDTHDQAVVILEGLPEPDPAHAHLRAECIDAMWARCDRYAQLLGSIAAHGDEDDEAVETARGSLTAMAGVLQAAANLLDPERTAQEREEAWERLEKAGAKGLRDEKEAGEG